MSNLNKIDVPIAITHKTKLDLSCDHVTSMDFMTTQPVFYRHMIKTEHINLNADSIVRPAPIEVPVYGSLKQNIRYFFVPYRLVFPNWSEFYNDVIASNIDVSGLVEGLPLVSNSTLKACFLQNALATPVGVGEIFDFKEAGTGYSYTPLGKFLLKILESLGYKIIWGSKTDTLQYNALALLAYLRVYVDWYANSQYLNSADVLLFERYFKFNDPSDNLELVEADLFSMLMLVRNVVYDTDDYYVNAWDNPVSPNSGQYTDFAMLDPTANNGAYVITNTLGTPEMHIGTNYNVGTTYIHEALKKLSDFQKRHALAGARSIDRVLAQYGVITDYLKELRSIYIGFQSTNVEIGSVYANADGTNGSSTSSVGDYAGAGYGQSNHTIDFTADEEGILIAVASIIPNGRLVQGYDRNNMHKSKTDFFVPELDSLGVQAIEKGEVAVFPSYAVNDWLADSADYQGVFGFTGRYGEYKRPKNWYTGDMTLPSVMQGGDAWHLFRLLGSGSFSDIGEFVHSLAFTRALDGSQYHRIFQYTFADRDPFYCFIHFNVASYAPCRPLFESYEFESDSKKVPTENGNKVN